MPAAKAVTEENATAVYLYLTRLFKDYHRLVKYDLPFSDHDQAEEELGALLRHESVTQQGHMGSQTEALNAWCDRWLGKEDRVRLWRALRQRRHQQRRSSRSLALPGNVYTRLQIFAEDRDLTLAQAVDRLLQAAERTRKRPRGQL